MGRYKTNKDYSEWWIEESYSSGDQEEEKNTTGKAEKVNLKLFFFFLAHWLKIPGWLIVYKNVKFLFHIPSYRQHVKTEDVM